MEITNLSAPVPHVPAPQAQAPQHVADQRPSADSAALSRNPRPDIPAPIAPATSQIGLVQQANLPPRATDDDGTADMPAPQAPERVLKPYGIAMLPERAPGALAPKAEETET
ncbi:hypothetical protein EU803_04225 [Loktanella sp. IMCC34160]|uniref:hypothetical protein n=1 Tax=Loktanella sp. IMCC34160 TaxID=2510646 RepID=UPI00101D0231|nr:hypothetical protein [Loktanella sp. IMCC34160]RYG93312.1 hypothetical protein EU803_04225 [Loktanella sp. IMCC34160]